MHKNREQMNVVIVGHVDHGKSTLIGRLLADTGTLPKGKLDMVRENCRRTSKPFEYAFLLDALKDEQSQGITIDTARCFFKSSKRDYIIIDAPGHIEFLKNMITGAARAQAAVLVIDAHEGIKENSKRHGYMMSFLGIKNLAVVVNKMDLVGYDRAVFESIQKEYCAFLTEINLIPLHFIPISAREGDNIVTVSSKMPWYQGLSAMQTLDAFPKAMEQSARPMRLPVQDIYKFTEQNDDRRIVAGRVESGSLRVGEEVAFFPANKRSRITSVEAFNVETRPEHAFAGQSVGICLDTQVYIRQGDVMCKTAEQPPHVGTKFKANIFWMGKLPLVKGKNYKLKIATQQVPVLLSEILSVLDASELSSITNKDQVDRHDVAECVLETLKPVAFDPVTLIPETGRFVIIDNYEISGGGIILAPVTVKEGALSRHIKSREFHWDRSNITPGKRASKYQHKSALIVVTGESDEKIKSIAKALEENLFRQGKFTYFLGVSDEMFASIAVSTDKTLARVQHIQQLGEMAHVLTDSGLLLITSIADVDEYEMGMLKSLNHPNKTLVVYVGENAFSEKNIDLALSDTEDPRQAAEEIINLLLKAVVLDPEYFI